MILCENVFPEWRPNLGVCTKWGFLRVPFYTYIYTPPKYHAGVASRMSYLLRCVLGGCVQLCTVVYKCVVLYTTVQTCVFCEKCFPDPLPNLGCFGLTCSTRFFFENGLFCHFRKDPHFSWFFHGLYETGLYKCVHFRAKTGCGQIWVFPENGLFGVLGFLRVFEGFHGFS